MSPKYAALFFFNGVVLTESKSQTLNCAECGGAFHCPNPLPFPETVVLEPTLLKSLLLHYYIDSWLDLASNSASNVEL